MEFRIYFSELWKNKPILTARCVFVPTNFSSFGHQRPSCLFAKRGKTSELSFFKNPPEPENKSMRKKYIFVKKIARWSERTIKKNYTKVIALLLFTQSLFYFPAFLETMIKPIIPKMTKKSIPKKRIFSDIIKIYFIVQNK